jgi:hypothetical protein
MDQKYHVKIKTIKKAKTELGRERIFGGESSGRVFGGESSGRLFGGESSGENLR